MAASSSSSVADAVTRFEEELQQLMAELEKEKQLTADAEKRLQLGELLSCTPQSD